MIKAGPVLLPWCNALTLTSMNTTLQWTIHVLFYSMQQHAYLLLPFSHVLIISILPLKYQSYMTNPLIFFETNWLAIVNSANIKSKILF